jgi:hypothetical protein
MKRNAGAGRTIAKGEAGFDAALRGTSFNTQDTGRRPALIVQANNGADVVAAVRQARAMGLTIGICSGGHSWAQNHIRAGGMVLDLSRLNSIAINIAEGTATIGPAAWLVTSTPPFPSAISFSRWRMPIRWGWAAFCCRAALAGIAGHRDSPAKASLVSTSFLPMALWSMPVRRRIPSCYGQREVPDPAFSVSLCAFT